MPVTALRVLASVSVLRRVALVRAGPSALAGAATVLSCRSRRAAHALACARTSPPPKSQDEADNQNDVPKNEANECGDASDRNAHHSPTNGGKLLITGVRSAHHFGGRAT